MKTHTRAKHRSTRMFLTEVYKPSLKAMIPNNFDPQICHEHLPPKTDKEKATEAYYFILNRICSKNDGPGFGLTPKFCEPVAVNHTIVKQIFGNEYTKYFSALRKSKVIVQHEKARSGVSSRTYFLGRNYREQATKVVEHSPKIREKIMRCFNTNRDKNEPAFLKYAHLIHWFTTSKLTIDKEGALQCEQLIEENLQEKLAEHSKPEMLEKFTKEALHREHKNKTYISKLVNHRHYGKIDKNTRLHTTLTSLPESMRCYLQYNGQELTAVDISNSQPFHFCYFFEKAFWSASPSCCSLKAIHPGLYNVFVKNGQLAKIRQLVRKSKKEKDVAEFLEKAKSGEIYEILSEKYGTTYKSLQTREKAKKEFIIFLNFDLEKRRHPRYAAYRQFALDFPCIAEMMELAKETYYKDIAIILQMFEAKMFLSKCGRNFENLHPNVPLFSIHDTMITLKSHQTELEEVIANTYQELLGFKPKLKALALNPSSAQHDLNKYVHKRYSKLVTNG